MCLTASEFGTMGGSKRRCETVQIIRIGSLLSSSLYQFQCACGYLISVLKVVLYTQDNASLCFVSEASCHDDTNLKKQSCKAQQRYMNPDIGQYMELVVQVVKAASETNIKQVGITDQTLRTSKFVVSLFYPKTWSARWRLTSGRQQRTSLDVDLTVRDTIEPKPNCNTCSGASSALMQDTTL
ncbi:hypothetical protein M404DRAFT_1002034, partial [Pisolithus tinctorius Marx 270]